MTIGASVMIYIHCHKPFGPGFQPPIYIFVFVSLKPRTYLICHIITFVQGFPTPLEHFRIDGSRVSGYSVTH